MKKNYLLLFTDFFPFDMWEPFLIAEMDYLAKSFDRIFIFSNHAGTGRPIYNLPSGVEAIFIPPSVNTFEKMSSIGFLFKKLFWEEMKFIKEQYKISRSGLRIRTALASLMLAHRYKKIIEKFILKKKLSDGNIYVYSYWTDYRAIAAALLKCDHSYVAISRAHNWDIYFERHKALYLPFRKFISQKISHIFFVSENGRNYFISKIGELQDNKTSVSRLGIGKQQPNQEPQQDEFTLISCSRLVPVKRVHLIIDILDGITEAPVRWIHFGSGPLRYQLEDYAHQKLDRHKNMRFEFRGDVKQEELMNFYCTQPVDLFLLTSEYEGMPYVIIEALSFCIPVMATDAGGIREAISNENGILLPREFDASKASQLLNDFIRLAPENKAAIRKAAFETWQSMFDAEKNYTSFISTVFNLRQSIKQ